MNKKSYILEHKDAIKWKRPKPLKRLNLIASDLTDDDIKNASLPELKKFLKICEQHFKSLQSEHCSELNDENFGGPSSQWGFKHHNDIQVCKRQIDIIKTKIKELNGKEK